MGVWKNDINGGDTPFNVVGQSVPYTDRDQQLELPFPKQTENPKEATERPWVREQREKRETQELFDNFKTVLKGKDVSLEDKQKIIITALNNFKTGNPSLSNISRAFLLDIFVYGL
jgi:hypothetical protein